MIKTRIGVRSLTIGLVIVVLLGMISRWSSVSRGEEPTGFTGTVTNMGNGQPIAGAQISAAGYVAVTDAGGRYTLPLSVGVYDVRADAPAYIGMTHTFRECRGMETLDFEMIPYDPSPEEAAVIEEKILGSAPEADEAYEHEAELLAQGYALSAITELPRTVRVVMPDETMVVMSLDEYLKGVVPSEMPAHWPMEALRAQAVAARSYAATRRAHAHQGGDVCTTTHCQVWRATHYDTTTRAVDDTRGVVGRYNGQIIYAFYHARCGGQTRNVEEVWGGYLPYCRSVTCPCGFTERYGHGVGMCQWGARALAIQGRNYIQILKHYYTGIDVPMPAQPSIRDASVQPASGDENTLFTFEATYENPLGDLPVVANVIIDGRARALERVSGTGNRWLYRLQTRLPAGTHDYRFSFDDGYGRITTHPASGAVTGPIVAAAPPASPTPTPSAGGVRVENIVHATPLDWAAGSFSGVQAVAADEGALQLQPGRTEGTYTSAVLSAPLTAIAVGLTWYVDLPAGASLAFQVRRSADGAIWGPWQDLPPSEDDTGRAGLRSSDLLFGTVKAVQYRVTLRANTSGASPLLKNVRVVLIDASQGPTAAELAAAQVLTTERRPPVIPRSGWGANEQWMTWPPEYRPVRLIILHHTATPDGGVDPAAMVRAIYYYHAVTREWGDIGYNFLVDRYGNIYEGRAGGVGVVGRHTGAVYSWGSLGVSLIGDYHTNNVPAAMLNRLTDLFAWQCETHGIDPLGTQYFIDRVAANISGHRDFLSSLCPGDRAYALLPSIRTQTRSKMTPMQARLASPADGQALRGVVELKVEITGYASRVDYYVDGVLRGSSTTNPHRWKWNTADEADGLHTVRILAQNSFEQSQHEIQVLVDNTPPSGSASVWSGWHNTIAVPFTLQATGATAVQFSNGWIWEGETLYYAPGTGRVVDDPAARSGRALFGQVGVEQAGAWFGPYYCALPRWRDYQVYFRLKTPDRAVESALATLDIADDQGRRVYAERTLYGSDFARSGLYEEFRLNLAYRDAAPSCRDPGISDGLEFRTAFRAVGSLYLDRVSLFSAPQLLRSPMTWEVLPVSGLQTVTVRFLDAAGNATDYPVTVRVDISPPRWFGFEAGAVWAQDSHAGLDTGSAAWTVSHDGGQTWEAAWRPIPLSAPYGTKEPVRLEADAVSGTHLRFRIRDVVGNEGQVDLPLALETMLPLPLVFRTR